MSCTNDTESPTRSTKNTEPSSHWAIVYLGIGKSNKEEYHILNRATGTYLTTTCKLPLTTRDNNSLEPHANNAKTNTAAAKDQDDVTCNLKSPLENVVRWSIAPVSNKPEQYGQYL
jgi:hypothetical protein